MCGIVGYIGPRNGIPLIIGGLEKLEYRGYDSAGIATIVGSKFEVFRSEGKLGRLKARLSEAGKFTESTPTENLHRSRTHSVGDTWPTVRDKCASPRGR